MKQFFGRQGLILWVWLMKGEVYREGSCVRLPEVCSLLSTQISSCMHYRCRVYGCGIVYSGVCLIHCGNDEICFTRGMWLREWMEMCRFAWQQSTLRQLRCFYWSCFKQFSMLLISINLDGDLLRFFSLLLILQISSHQFNLVIRVRSLSFNFVLWKFFILQSIVLSEYLSLQQI